MVWLDGEVIAECTSCKLVVKPSKEKVDRVGHMISDHKITSVECTGSIDMHKVRSRMIHLLATAFKTGNDPRFTINSKLADPDAYGSERIVATGVSFDDLTLADWKAATMGTLTVPFTFTDYDIIDTIPEG